MNLNKLFEIQSGLDHHIVKEKGLEGQDLLEYKILALQVELGELANEWRGFKFWSNDQEPRINEPFHSMSIYEGQEIPDVEYRNLLLEEYVDCLHFILSIGLELDRKDEALPYVYNYSPDASNDEIVGQFGHVFKNTWNVHGDYYNLINGFIELGSMLGFIWEQIEQAYLDKNKINHERQLNGY